MLFLSLHKTRKTQSAASSGKYIVVSSLNLFVSDNDDALIRWMRCEAGPNSIVHTQPRSAHHESSHELNKLSRARSWYYLFIYISVALYVLSNRGANKLCHCSLHVGWSLGTITIQPFTRDNGLMAGRAREIVYHSIRFARRECHVSILFQMRFPFSAHRTEHRTISCRNKRMNGQLSEWAEMKWFIYVCSQCRNSVAYLMQRFQIRPSLDRTVALFDARVQ